MSDLLEFLAARLDEDEAAAKAAASRPLGDAWGGVVDGTRLTAVSAHIARHDPARALREVAAKRARLQRHQPVAVAGHDVPLCVWCSSPPASIYQEWPCPDIRGDAAVYSDHPDYQQEWRL